METGCENVIGVASTISGSKLGMGDGECTKALLKCPIGITIDSQGTTELERPRNCKHNNTMNSQSSKKDLIANHKK